MAHDETTVLGRFSLEQEIGRFDSTATPAGRRAETLIKTDGLRVVLVTMVAGAHLAEHTAPGPISIQVLRGAFTVSAGGGDQTLAAGELIALASGAPHAVTATAAGAFLLTIGA